MHDPNDPDDRFGMPCSAFEAARRSHAPAAGVTRSGMYVPTRREVAEESAEWLRDVLIDWFWESPSELIPTDEQIKAVRSVLSARRDVQDPRVQDLLAECDAALLPPNAGADRPPR